MDIIPKIEISFGAYLIDSVAVICWDSNPVTTVYELVEFLNSKRI